METHEEYARRFIAAQTERFNELNVNGMTRRQRARIKALDVVNHEQRARVLSMAGLLPRELGRPPHGDSGHMRVVNWHTGEVRIERAPARRLDVQLDEVVAEVVI